MSLLSVAALSQEKTLYDVLDEFNVKQADSLYLNMDDDHYFVKLSPKEFHKQSFRLVDESPFEELFMYSAKDSVAIEVSKSNTPKGVMIDNPIAGALYRVIDDVIISHQHVKSHSEHIVQKLSSHDDIGFLFVNTAWGRKVNIHSTVLHVNYSVHGLTKYEITDTTQTDFFNYLYDEGKLELFKSLLEIQKVGIHKILENKTSMHSVVGTHRDLDCPKIGTCDSSHYFEKRELVNILGYGMDIPPFSIRFYPKDYILYTGDFSFD